MRVIRSDVNIQCACNQIVLMAGCHEMLFSTHQIVGMFALSNDCLGYCSKCVGILYKFFFSDNGVWATPDFFGESIIIGPIQPLIPFYFLLGGS